MSITSPTSFEQQFIDAVEPFLIPHDEEAGTEDAWVSDENVMKLVMNSMGMLSHRIDLLDSMVTVTIGTGFAAGDTTLTNDVFTLVVLQSAVLGLYNILGNANKSNLKVQLPNLKFEQTDRIKELQKVIEENRDMLEKAIMAYQYDLRGGYVLVAGTTTVEYVGS